MCETIQTFDRPPWFSLRFVRLADDFDVERWVAYQVRLYDADIGNRIRRIIDGLPADKWFNVDRVSAKARFDAMAEEAESMEPET